MAENKTNATESLTQLKNFKSSSLGVLNSDISGQKSRATTFLISIKAAKTRFQEAESVESTAKTEIVKEAVEAPVEVKEKTEKIVEKVVAPKVDIEPKVETKVEKAEPAPIKAEIPTVKTETVEAPVQSKVKTENIEKESVEPKPAQVVEEKKAEKAPEILPNGEVRRVWTPPVVEKKPRIQTRDFGKDGYKSRPNQGGFNNQNRPPRPAGQGGYQGGQQNGQGQRPFQPRVGGFNASSMPASNLPQKPGQQKTRTNKGNNNFARNDDRGSMNKKALIKKGYVVSDNGSYDDDYRVKNYKVSKNRGGGNSATVFIEHAVISHNPVPIKTLSEKIGKSSAEIIKTLFLLGIIKTINESIDFDTAELVAGEYKITLEYKPDQTFEDTLRAKKSVADEEDSSLLISRAPIITIMGHVDHGKTSLLDYIRKTNVTSGEAGGITQHIGAYTVKLDSRPITFLDTPGHEAFTSMRARGTQVTDIAILVVAADDGIMPQTIESISHAKQANVPVIVAVNKMDKETANPDRILSQLTEHGITPEIWGGDTPVVKVSAKTGYGIEDLLENILILADILELKANPDRLAKGTIVEARLDKGLGKVATILVQTGTLKIGDSVVAGTATGRIRTMIDDKGKNIKVAGPSTPVSVTGWDDVPEAGDIIDVVEDEKFARELAEERKIKLQEQNKSSQSVSLADLFEKIKKGELKTVKLIVKADVQGSLEAVKQSLSKLGNEEVGIEIIHGGVGAVKESDVVLADTAKAIIIGFNVGTDQNARQIASMKKIDIRNYSIIYDAIEDVEKAVKGLLAPKYQEVLLGSAEIREIYKISGIGSIAGSHVIDGKIVRNAKARLIRNGKIEYTGEISSLRHGKDDVKEMAKNFDCGIMLTNFNDVKQGDIIEAFKMEEIDV